MNNRTSNAITAPYGLWMAVFIVAPLAIVAYYALTDAAGNFSLDNITQLSLYTDTIFRSVWFIIIDIANVHISVIINLIRELAHTIAANEGGNIHAIL